MFSIYNWHLHFGLKFSLTEPNETLVNLNKCFSTLLIHSCCNRSIRWRYQRKCRSMGPGKKKGKHKQIIKDVNPWDNPILQTVLCPFIRLDKKYCLTIDAIVLLALPLILVKWPLLPNKMHSAIPIPIESHATRLLFRAGWCWSPHSFNPQTSSIHLQVTLIPLR